MALRTQPTAPQDALNEITPGKVLEAMGLVRQGLVHDLAHALHHDIPAFPGRLGATGQVEAQSLVTTHA